MFGKNDRVRARYTDNAWYPARIVDMAPRRANRDPEEGDTYIIRWDPPDPNIPETYRVHEDDILPLR